MGGIAATRLFHEFRELLARRVETDLAPRYPYLRVCEIAYYDSDPERYVIVVRWRHARETEFIFEPCGSADAYTDPCMLDKHDPSKRFGTCWRPVEVSKEWRWMDDDGRLRTNEELVLKLVHRFREEAEAERPRRFRTPTLAGVASRQPA